MKLPNKLNQRLYLSHIQQSTEKPPLQQQKINHSNESNLYSQSQRNPIRILINETKPQNDKGYLHKTQSKVLIRFKPNRKTTKPISFRYNKQLIDIYHITPGQMINKESKRKRFSSIHSYPCINRTNDKKTNHSYPKSLMQRSHKVCIPINKTNYFKKEGIIPGDSKKCPNKSFTMINNFFTKSTSLSMIRHMSHNSKPKKVMASSKSESCLKKTRYKIKIK